jgi:hypothetical protein
MHEAMSKYAVLNSFEGKKMAKHIVVIFGTTFLVSAAFNILKAVYFDTLFATIVTEKPIELYSWCFLTDILTEVVPIQLMVYIHRKNFSMTN